MFMRPIDTSKHVNIYFDPKAGVLAEGGDDLAHTLLIRAGFAPSTVPGRFSLPQTWDNEQLADAIARAARMLRVTEYIPLISAELKSIPEHTAWKLLSAHSTLCLGVEELNSELSSRTDLADLARMADQIFNEGEGVLQSVEEFATQAAHHLAAIGTEQAGAVADQFLSIARRLDTITAIYGCIAEDLVDVHDRVNGLDPDA